MHVTIKASYDTQDHALECKMDWAAWQQFLAGHWQKEMPQKCGWFPRADRLGYQATAAFVCRDDKNGWFTPHGPWEAWWWSEPMPDLPRPGAWEDR